MKHGRLRSVAHSIADSLASGVSLMTGFYDLNVYADAARSDGGVLIVDLMNGRVIAGQPSLDLASAILRIPEEFDRLCRVNGVARDDCQSAQARFYAQPAAPGFTLVVKDRSGKRTETDYQGIPARRVIETDRLGRARQRPVRNS